MHQSIQCPHCGGPITAHYEVFQHATCQRGIDDHTAWQMRKRLNKAARYQDRFRRDHGWRNFMKAKESLDEAARLAGQRRCAGPHPATGTRP